MSSGRLARIFINNATTLTNIYTVPTNKIATVNLLVTNSSGLVSKFRCAISNSSTSPGPQDYIEFDVNLPAISGVLERTALVLGPGESIFVYSSVANAITVRVNGYEEDQ